MLPYAFHAPALRFRQTVMVLTLAVYLYYLVYRLLYTINHDALTFSVVFYYAELHGFISLALYFFQLWRPIHRTPSPAPPGLAVDVFIPTYKEDISLLRKTVIGCLQMTYPHTTYILDDGTRPECAALAAELGCEYVARTEHAHAKAGNLNHALPVSSGEFVAVFDADFVPQPHFLDTTLGYFSDSRLAFVQTPQHFYNTDSLTFRFNVTKRERWTEQDVFFRLMMPARDYWNSSFFVGTSAVFRRRALEDIGGFAVETITEDLHTSVRIYKKGWRGLYHNEPLSNGLAANDLKNYHTQKLRWAQGNIALLFVENPLWTKGLTLPQRICFFASVFSWLIGLPKLIYFIAPAIMLLTGRYPIDPFDWPLIWRYGLFLAVVISSIKIVSRGHTRLFGDEISHMLNFFVLIKAIVKSPFRRKARFVVTGKGAGQHSGLQGLAPQLTIIALCFAGVEWGALKWFYSISRDRLGLAMAIFWALNNGVLAALAVATVTAPLYRRQAFRFEGAIPVDYTAESHHGTLHGQGVTADVSDTGVALITPSALPVGDPVHLRLHLGSQAITCHGIVRYVQKGFTSTEGPFRYGVQFINLTQAQLDIITTFCFNRMLPTFLQRAEATPSSSTRLLAAWRRLRQRRHPTPSMPISVPVISETASPNSHSCRPLDAEHQP